MIKLIKEFRKASDLEWDRIVNADPHSTYFHTREWFEIWEKYAEIKPETQIITLANGKEVLFTLAVKPSYGGIFKHYLSSPGGTYGGFISESILDSEEKSALKDYLRKFSYLNLRQNPYSLIMESFAGWSRNDFTQTIDLRENFEEMFKKWRKGHKCAIKKGLREGVTVRETESKEDWKKYYEIYKASLKRWGEKATSKYSWEIFRLIFSLNSPKIKLHVAEYRGKIIAGALCFYHNKHIAAWHGVALEEYFTVKVAHVLYYEIIKKGAQDGFYWYDFNPSGGHEKVNHFKDGFNPLEKVTNILQNESSLVKSGKYLKSLIKT